MLDEQDRRCPSRRPAGGRGGPARPSPRRRARRPARRAAARSAGWRRRGRWRAAGAGRTAGPGRCRSRSSSRRNSRIAATTSPGSGGATGMDEVAQVRQRSRGSDAARRLSSTVASSNSSSDWNERLTPARARFVALSPISSSPSRSTEPLAARVKPVTASITDVLPAPFGPIRPVMRPGAHRERHVVDGDDAAVADAQAAHLERAGVDRLALLRRQLERRRAAAPADGGSWRGPSRPATWTWLIDSLAMPSWFCSTSRTTSTPPMSWMYRVIAVEDGVGELGAERAGCQRRAEDRAEQVADAADERPRHDEDRREVRELRVVEDHVLAEREQHAADGGDARRHREGVHLGAGHADAERRGGPLVGAHGQQPPSRTARAACWRPSATRGRGRPCTRWRSGRGG